MEDFGLSPDVIDAMALNCHTCLLPGNCPVKRDNVLAESMDRLKVLLTKIIEIKSIDTVKIVLVGQTNWLDMNMNVFEKKIPACSAV